MFLTGRAIGWIGGMGVLGVLMLLFPDFFADSLLPGGLEESDRKWLTRGIGLVACGSAAWIYLVLR